MSARTNLIFLRLVLPYQIWKRWNERVMEKSLFMSNRVNLRLHQDNGVVLIIEIVKLKCSSVEE